MTFRDEDDEDDDKLPPEPYREIVIRMSDDREDVEILYLDPQACELGHDDSPGAGQDQQSPKRDPEE